MKSDKEIKKEFRPVFWRNPERYFATEVLKEEGFRRGICAKCGKPFWNVDSERKVCGDPACSGEGFAFIGNSPARRRMSFTDIWKTFSEMFKGFGYTPVKRYPVVSRWNSTMEYTNASIAAFQPFVISGEVEPPANPLVIPQFCLRFNDIDNVGITESHNTGFVMIGQHMFVSPNRWDQNRAFRDIHNWLRKGLGLPNSEITYHEDAWAGGGNFGCCMEFFSRGCELGNQVYMLYEQTPSGNRELGLKVLDMGMGQERNAWFSQGSPTIYDATFPEVIKYLLKKTGLKYDKILLGKYVPHAGLLNLDETENVDESWKTVAKNVGTGVDDLRNFILPLAGLYSVAEHSRSLLISLSDGALPSNVGGGYNLRILTRRALNFIDKYDWNIDLADVCRKHAKSLRPMYPELEEHLEDVRKILDVEKGKYRTTREKSKGIISAYVKKGIRENDLLKLYDSHGINPEIVRDEALKAGRQIKVPEDFYSKIANLHEKTANIVETGREEKIDLSDIGDTKLLYLGDYRLSNFSASVIKVSGRFVILDQTAFYPTSGGQLHDLGTLNGRKVKDVFKQGGVIVHEMERNHRIKKGDRVQGSIDLPRRTKLAQHHTATHIINAAARQVLGNHVNQAGAKKTESRAHLDITHYLPLTLQETERIEKSSNGIVKRSIPIKKLLLPRNEAEKAYGMRIYQGGAVPGRQIRIVEIPGVDVEACGGTHLNNTSEAGKIKILKSTKVQDGVIRIEFTAGESAKIAGSEETKTLKNIIVMMKRVANVKGKPKDPSSYLKICSEIFSVPAEQAESTTKKFVVEIGKKRLKKRGFDIGSLEGFRKLCSYIFSSWKEQRKLLEKGRLETASSSSERFIKKARENFIREMVDMDRKEMIKTAESIISKRPDLTVMFANKAGEIVGMSRKEDIVRIVRDLCRKCGGSGGGKGHLAQGKLSIKELEKLWK